MTYKESERGTNHQDDGAIIDEVTLEAFINNPFRRVDASGKLSETEGGERSHTLQSSQDIVQQDDFRVRVNGPG